MARSKNQKQKLLWLAKIFFEETDETHGLSMSELISRLENLDISADRKTLYMDMEELRSFGMDIIAAHDGKKYYYYLGARTFELPELKLLVDAVQSSRFITEKKSRELIRKLQKLAGKHDADRLQSQIILSERVKSMNESIYYNIDRIEDAINDNRQISFQYFQWNMEKKPEYRRGGALYIVSPWYLWESDENYYLIAYDADADQQKHYRVDKMKNITILSAPRQGEELRKKIDPASYTNSLFGMYGGKTECVTLEAVSTMAGVLIDRFGADIPIVREDSNHFSTQVNVAVSPQFLGWVASLNGNVWITSPESVVQQMRELADNLLERYQR